MGEDPHASSEHRVVLQRDQARIGDQLGVHEHAVTDLHPHGLQEEQAEGRQGEEGKHRVANEVEEAVVQVERHRGDREVPALERPHPGGEHEVVDGDHEQEREAEHEEGEAQARSQPGEASERRPGLAHGAEPLKDEQGGRQRDSEGGGRHRVEKQDGDHVGRVVEPADEAVEGVPRRRVGDVEDAAHRVLVSGGFQGSSSSPGDGHLGRWGRPSEKVTLPSSTQPRMPGSQMAPFTRWQRPSISCGQPQLPLMRRNRIRRPHRVPRRSAEAPDARHTGSPDRRAKMNLHFIFLPPPGMPSERDR